MESLIFLPELQNKLLDKLISYMPHKFGQTAVFDLFEYDENVFAAYVNYAKSWDKWDLNIGLRTEQTNIEGRSLSLTESNTQNYFNWFPNTSVSHKIADDFSINANYKRSITYYKIFI